MISFCFYIVRLQRRQSSDNEVYFHRFSRFPILSSDDDVVNFIIVVIVYENVILRDVALVFVVVVVVVDAGSDSSQMRGGFERGRGALLSGGCGRIRLQRGFRSRQMRILEDARQIQAQLLEALPRRHF